jgi:fucokinase
MLFRGLATPPVVPNEPVAPGALEVCCVDSDRLERTLNDPMDNRSIDDLLYRAVRRGNSACTDVFAALDRVASTAAVNVASRAFALIARTISMMRQSRVASQSAPVPVEPRAGEPWNAALTAVTNSCAVRSQRARGVQTMGALRAAAAAAHVENEREGDPLAVAQWCYARLSDALTATACSTAFAMGAARAPAEQPALGAWLRVETPSRIDLAGGWTDSPPMCYESGGAVVNVAVRIDGVRRIGCRIRRVRELALTFTCLGAVPPRGGDGVVFAAAGTPRSAVCTTLDDVRDYCDPHATCALLKAAAVCCGIVDVSVGAAPLREQLAEDLGCGLVLESWATVPLGSGLGTSSTLGATLITAISWAAGRGRQTARAMTHGVIELAVMSGDDAGFQDHAGGSLPGAKLLTTEPHLPYRVRCDRLRMDDAWAAKLSRHLVLVFTGRSHHMPDIGSIVTNRWHARVEEMVTGIHGLLANAMRQAEALRERDIAALGEQLDEYWRLKQLMDPDCEPAEATALMGALRKTGLIVGVSLMGGGGGGFLLAVTKEPDQLESVKAAIVASVERALESNLTFHTVCVDAIGMVAGVDGEPLEPVYTNEEMEELARLPSAPARP